MTAMINYSPALVNRLVDAGAFAGDPLTLVDVGCAGGIEPHWRAFPLRSRAIDPMLREVERLRSLERDPSIEYVSGFVRKEGWPDAAVREAGSDNIVLPRSSCLSIALRTQYNAWSEAKLSERILSLDEMADGLGGVDFLKTDTDGGDLEVLNSGEQMLKGALGVSVEAVIQSSSHPLSNSRSNIDQYLRGLGFSLFDEQTFRYSRAALPDRFFYNIPAQTNRGQICWGQCLYLRDLAADGDRWSDGAFRKLACIMEVYGLNDCAAELIQARPDAFAPYICPTEALDVLTAEWWPGEYATHAELMAAFDADHTTFYP